MYITLEQIKSHLNIDSSFDEDNLLLLDYITTAEDAVSKHIDKSLDKIAEGDMLPSSVVQAILLMVGNLYNNREAITYSNAVEVPLGYRYLLDPYKNYNQIF